MPTSIPGITGLEASLGVLNGWFSSWQFDFGSSFLNDWTINGPLVSLVAGVL